MKSFQALLLLVGLVTFSTAHAVCTPPAGDSELTLQGIMVNFGSELLAADALGRETPATAGEQDFKEASAGIEAAMECAKAVLDDTTGQLNPSEAAGMALADQDAYIKKFKGYMQNFYDALSTYDAEVLSQLSTAPEKRDFTMMLIDEDDVMDAARVAHGGLL